MVDVLGLLICIVVHAANIQERAGGKMLLAKAYNKGLPRLEKVLADDGYSGKPMEEHVLAEHGWKFESVKRTELHKFEVMPKRWVVERSIGWANNFRALSKDYDTDPKTSEAKILLTSIYYLSKRLSKQEQEQQIDHTLDARLRKLAENTNEQTPQPP
jgi:putative transposase